MYEFVLVSPNKVIAPLLKDSKDSFDFQLYQKNILWGLVEGGIKE